MKYKQFPKNFAQYRGAVKLTKREKNNLVRILQKDFPKGQFTYWICSGDTIVVGHRPTAGKLKGKFVEIIVAKITYELKEN